MIFLMSYKIFMTPIELLEKIILMFVFHFFHFDPFLYNNNTTKSYCTSPSSVQNNANTEVAEKIKFVRLKVLNFLKRWINIHPYDFVEVNAGSDKMTNLFSDFIEIIKMSGFAIFAEQLSKSIKNICSAAVSKSENAFSEFPNNIQNFDLLDLSPAEVAKQLTIMEQTIYNSLQAREFLNLNW